MTQAQDVLKFLKDGFTLTSLKALSALGVISFPKRICELRRQGHQIEQRRIKLPNGKRVNEYWMECSK